MRQVVRSGLLVALATAMFAGCKQEAGSDVSGTAPAGGPKLAYLTNNVSDFWTIAQKGVNKAERELGVTVTFRQPLQGSVEEQVKFLEDFATQGYDAVAISPKDADNMTDILNKRARDYKLICVDSDAPKSDRIAYVGTDNYAAGRKLGEILVKLFPEGGEMVVFVGTLDAQNAQDRYKGIKDVLKDNGDRITEARAPMLDETDRGRAKGNVENVLTSIEGVDALVGLWSYNGPSIASAVESQGRQGKVKIVCFDEEEETLAGIRNGVIDATVVQDPFQFSYEAVKLMVDLVRKGPEAAPRDGTLYIDARVIDKTNVDAFARELAERKKKPA